MTFDDLKPLTDWLQANPGLAGFATFVISIAESLAIIGLLIPGTLVMGAIGALIGSGILPGIEITLWAIAGAIVGDGMSYWLGYHYHGHIREMWPFRSYPALLQKGENFFLKYGGMSVFMGRFIGPIRPIIPVVAGMMNMPPSRFTLANVGSAIAWAPAYMMPGILLGALSLQLAPQAGARFLLRAILALLLLWFIYWFLKVIYRLLAKIINYQIASLWAKMQKRPDLYKIRRYLQDPIFPENHTQLTLILTFLFSLLVFIGFSIYAYQIGAMTRLNTIPMEFMISIRFDMGDKVMTTIALLGDSIVLLTLFLGVLGWFLFKRYRRAAKYWFILGFVTTASVFLLQWAIPYPHSHVLTMAVSGWAFPSLSTALQTALLGYLAVLLAQRAPAYRPWFYSITILLITLISLAELYLSIHGFVAIISGILLGFCSMAGVTFWYRRRYVAPLSVSGVLIVALSILSLAWAGVIYFYYSTALEQYSPRSLPPTIFNAEKWWSMEEQPNLYREDSMGTPIELLNVQWMGSLKSIERELRANGWEIVPKPDIAVIINRIAAKNRYEQLPLFPKLYLNRKAALIMTRKVGNPERMLVLRLWDSNIQFNTPFLPLWIGSINYHVPWHAPRLWKPRKTADMPVSSSATDILTKALTVFTWKTAPTSAVDCMERLKNTRECEGNIILIQPRK